LPEWFSYEYLSEIIELIKNSKISFTSAKVILSELLNTDSTPNEVADQKNLFQENDTDKISEMIVQILEDNQDVVDRIKTGEDKLVGFLVGLVMKQSNGSVNPGMAKELLLKKIKD
jgi:aspartyl-tRNA(Asn)/glutamyl-tRNA(Gln) amidotransferase subunit B